MFGGLYRNILGKRLRSFGLKFDDLLVENEDVAKAISRLAPAVRVERDRRIKRAFDISAKKKILPTNLYDHDVFDFYLQPHVEVAKTERLERILFRP